MMMKDDVYLQEMVDRFCWYLFLVYRPSSNYESRLSKMHSVLGGAADGLPDGFVRYFEAIAAPSSSASAALLSDFLFVIKNSQRFYIGKGLDVEENQTKKDSFFRAIEPLLQEYAVQQKYDKIEQAVNTSSDLKYRYMKGLIRFFKFLHMYVISRHIEARYEKNLAPRREFLQGCHSFLREKKGEEGASLVRHLERQLLVKTGAARGLFSKREKVDIFRAAPALCAGGG
jgi:hypothetical protein